jgi:hypothetical protein
MAIRPNQLKTKACKTALQNLLEMLMISPRAKKVTTTLASATQT